MNRLTEDDLDIIKKSLQHGYLIPHELIRKLVEENERLTKRLNVAEYVCRLIDYDNHSAFALIPLRDLMSPDSACNLRSVHDEWKVLSNE